MVKTILQIYLLMRQYRRTTILMVGQTVNSEDHFVNRYLSLRLQQHSRVVTFKGTVSRQFSPLVV